MATHILLLVQIAIITAMAAVVEKRRAALVLTWLAMLMATADGKATVITGLTSLRLAQKLSSKFGRHPVYSEGAFPKHSKRHPCRVLFLWLQS
jgi:hypothetical protein